MILLNGKALHQIDDDVAGPIFPWYVIHVLACTIFVMEP